MSDPNDQLCGCGRPLRHQGMCATKWAQRGGKPKRTIVEAPIRVEEIVPPPPSPPSAMRVSKARRGDEAPTEAEIAEAAKEYDNYLGNVAQWVDSKGGRKPVSNGRELDVRLLRVAGALALNEGEAAVLQGISPQVFSKMMQRRDPQTGRKYRDIFDEGQLHGKVSAKRQAWKQMQMMNSAGVQAMKWWTANNLGWTERRFEERVGMTEHRHAHAHLHKAIPADSDLQKMSDKELIELAIENGGTKH